MSEVQFYDSVKTAVKAVEAEDKAPSYADSIKGVDFNNDQQTMAFLEPQLLRVEQGVYMVKYPAADYANFMPVDTEGTVWSKGSIFYSGDIAGKPEWYDVAADDMPYADASRTQFLQENHMAGIGYKWNRGDLEASQQLGRNILSEKAGAASFSAERFIHNTAMRGDGTKYATGFINNPLATTVASGATITASNPDAAVTIIVDALHSVEVNTGETFMADTVLLPSSTYRDLAGRRMTDTNMTVLAYIRENLSEVTGGTINIGRSRHLETAGAGNAKRMITYANNPEVHRFHLPGGGHQFFPTWQKGPFSWEVPGIMNIGGYENRIPLAITMTDGV